MQIAWQGPLPDIDAIVMGASTGGIEALTRLLSKLPARFPLPIAVVLHLSADHPSLLLQVFGPRCQLKVVGAEDKEPFLAGNVYFAPPDYHLLVEAPGQLALSVDLPRNYSRPSIDMLFESAADSLKSRVLGILLTGASSDGAQGLRAISAAGGFTVVQDPDDALAPDMPRAALRSHTPNAVLSCDAIGALLLQFAGNPAR